MEEICFLIPLGVLILAIFLRIEHRLTKIETKVDHLEKKIDQCRPS